MDVVKAQEIALKHAKAMAKELAAEVVLVAIEQAVQNSPNKIDDVVWIALKAEVLNQIEKI